jgi:hypothetical protein
MSHRTTRIIAAAAIAGALSACAAIWGVEDGILDVQPNNPQEAGATDSQVEDVLKPPPVDTGGCDTEKPDDVKGIFVSPGGTSAANCGSALQPCNTVQLGIDRATTVPGKSIVYLDQGTYKENLILKGGVYVQGGWNSVGEIWKRQCIQTRAESATIIANSGPVTVSANDLGKESTLDTLTIRSKPDNQVGATESLVGLLAAGATTSIRLVDVIVQVGNAGSGNTGGTGAPGAAAADAGTCPTGSGAAGGAGSPGSGASPGGYFPPGYYGGFPGGSGTAGRPGQNGSAPATAPQTGTCLDCATATVPNCNNATADAGAGTPGLAGCAGGGGAGGGGGSYGGSSVALLAYDARVLVFGGALRAGNGGNGGPGGPGGAGAPGTAGIAGQVRVCATSCKLDSINNVCVNDVTINLAGGSAGGNGGAGGAGGKGGGGSAGDSFAIVQAGGATVAVSGTQLVHGNPGTAVDNGAPGKAGDVGP